MTLEVQNFTKTADSIDVEFNESDPNIANYPMSISIDNSAGFPKSINLTTWCASNPKVDSLTDFGAVAKTLTEYAVDQSTTNNFFVKLKKSILKEKTISVQEKINLLSLLRTKFIHCKKNITHDPSVKEISFLYTNPKSNKDYEIGFVFHKRGQDHYQFAMMIILNGKDFLYRKGGDQEIELDSLLTPFLKYTDPSHEEALAFVEAVFIQVQKAYVEMPKSVIDKFNEIKRNAASHLNPKEVKLFKARILDADLSQFSRIVAQLNLHCHELPNALHIEKSCLYSERNAVGYPNSVIVHTYDADIGFGAVFYVLSGKYKDKNEYFQFVMQLKWDVDNKGLLFRPHHLVHGPNSAGNANIDYTVYGASPGDNIVGNIQGGISTHKGGVEQIASPHNLQIQGVAGTNKAFLLKSRLNPTGRLVLPMTTFHVLALVSDKFDPSLMTDIKSLQNALASFLISSHNNISKLEASQFIDDLTNEIAQLEGI